MCGDLRSDRCRDVTNIGGDNGGDIVHLVPKWFWQVPYVAARYPGAVPRGALREGANCQLWAYELLAHFGFFVPDLRSYELWHDKEATVAVEVQQPLDLVLFNADDEPWGAHVGVWVDAERVAHLSREMGYPAVWSLHDFAERERYRVLVGSKRPTLRNAPSTDSAPVRDRRTGR